MAIVSILIPAFRAKYLQQALSSALNQTFSEIEILVGDDTVNGDLKDVVGLFDDPRIQYFHHGFRNGVKNSMALWERASGQYIKWLYDDDLLMPTSVEVLVAALRANPASALAFHGRVFIDADGKLLPSPQPLLATGQVLPVDKAFLLANMVARQDNFIGEPSNTLLNKQLTDVSRHYQYGSWDLCFLTDVATYLYAADRAPLIAVGGQLSGFRQHAGQNSNAGSPYFCAGLFEWEVILRAAAAERDSSGASAVSPDALALARQRLGDTYGRFVGRFPELRNFIDGLPELTDSPPEQLLDTDHFKASLRHASDAVAVRIAQTHHAEKPLPCVCAVCGQRTEKWLAHPDSQRPNNFLLMVESVGSILDKHHCPNCYCNDRDRHLWLYLKRAELLQNMPAKRVLHIAPEARLEPLINAMRPREYLRGDLFPRSPEHHKVNVEALQFPDNYFDLIICNHVLEHVNNPAQALAEFQRCLAPGGRLVAQTPYSPKLKRTFEMNYPVSSSFATLFFGQDDHVRLFGADIVDYFHAAGFKGDLLPHATVLHDVDPDEWGCNVREPFFLFSKDGIA